MAGDVTTACVSTGLTTAFNTMPDTRLKLGIHDKRPGDTVLVPSLAGMTGELTAACMTGESKWAFMTRDFTTACFMLSLTVAFMTGEVTATHMIETQNGHSC